MNISFLLVILVCSKQFVVGQLQGNMTNIEEEPDTEEQIRERMQQYASEKFQHRYHYWNESDQVPDQSDPNKSVGHPVAVQDGQVAGSAIRATEVQLEPLGGIDKSVGDSVQENNKPVQALQLTGQAGTEIGQPAEHNIRLKTGQALGPLKRIETVKDGDVEKLRVRREFLTAAAITGIIGLSTKALADMTGFHGTTSTGGCVWSGTSPFCSQECPPEYDFIRKSNGRCSNWWFGGFCVPDDSFGKPCTTLLFDYFFKRFCCKSDPKDCSWSGRWMGANTAYNMYCRYDNVGSCGSLDCAVNNYNYKGSSRGNISGERCDEVQLFGRYGQATCGYIAWFDNNGTLVDSWLVGYGQDVVRCSGTGRGWRDVAFGTNVHPKFVSTALILAVSVISCYYLDVDFSVCPTEHLVYFVEDIAEIHEKIAAQFADLFCQISTEVNHFSRELVPSLADLHFKIMKNVNHAVEEVVVVSSVFTLWFRDWLFRNIFVSGRIISHIRSPDLNVGKFSLAILVPFALVALPYLVQCGGKKKEEEGGAAGEGKGGGGAGASKKEGDKEEDKDEKSNASAAPKGSEKPEGSEKPPAPAPPASGGPAPPRPPEKTGMAATHDPNYQTLAGIGNDCFANKGGPAPPPAGAPAPAAPKPPAQKGMAGTHDPNYQTLAGLGQNVFGEDQKGGGGGGGGAGGGGPPKAPAPGKGGMAATHDPNYQTLAGIGADCFGADQKGGGGGGGAAPAAPKPPAKAGVAATHDPNYQTLAGLGGDVFGADQKKAGGGGGGPPAAPKPPAKAGVAATHDPNYQTLAGLGGDVFGADQKKAGGGGGPPAPPKPPAKAGVAATHDPNYQTLAGLGGDVFGADQKKK